MSLLPLAFAFSLASAPVTFPSSSNWSVAAEPPSGKAVVLNQITVAPGAALLWNGSRVTDAQVLSYAKIVAQLQPGPVTALVLRPGVTDERRGALISLLHDAGICTVNHPCTLVENWAAEVAINPPPAPPTAPPAG